MKIAVVGSGGREHAITRTLRRFSHDAWLVSADEALHAEADLYVIGPEQPLVNGLADRLRADGKVVCGPGADGAMLEGSKAWMKDAATRAGIPTAPYIITTKLDQATKNFLEQYGGRVAVKTDGLAAGKGVKVCRSYPDAYDDIKAKLSGEAFGDAGKKVVVEQLLEGPEATFFALCDGNKAIACGTARDYKRLLDGDEGPNTGGMGAESPVPGVLEQYLLETFVLPLLRFFRSIGIDYRGVLYVGLMLTAEGPKLVEYNIRFGDPEAQVVLPRMVSDLGVHLYQAAAGDLRTPVVFSDDCAVTVVMASKEYPDKPKKSFAIKGIKQAEELRGVTVFPAGTRRDDAGDLWTDGGRVLDVTGQGATRLGARQQAYAGVHQISWPGAQFRSDIAERPI